MTENPFEFLSIDGVLSALRLSAVDRPSVTPWMKHAREVPRDFLNWLYRESNRMRGSGSRSTPFRRYRFFDEFVARHLQSNTPAFVYFDSGLNEISVSYAQLHEASAQRAAQWRGQGVSKETVVGIIRPLDTEMLVSVLTAFRLGVPFCWIPSSGECVVRKRLSAAPITHLDIDPRYKRSVTFDGPLLTHGGGELVTAEHMADMEAGDYLSGAPACFGFDESSEGYCQAQPITSDTLFFGALQAGSVTLELRKRDRLIHFGPTGSTEALSRVLAAWSIGATYVEGGDISLWSEPGRLAGLSARTVCMSASAMTHVSTVSIRLENLAQLIVRDPRESASLSDWASAIDRCHLKNVYFGNYVPVSVAIPSGLSSLKRLGLAHDNVLPPFGYVHSIGAPDLPPGMQASLGDLYVELLGAEPAVETKTPLSLYGTAELLLSQRRM